MSEEQRRELRVVPTPEMDPRPEIRITHEMDRMVEEAIEALSKSVELYQRGGILVDVIDPSLGPGRITSPLIRELPLPTLRVLLMSAVRWMKFDGRGNLWKRTKVPDDVVQAVRTRGSWRTPRTRIHDLAAVITSPTLRPDGSVIQAPGFDVPTGILFRPRGRFAPVAEEPTKEDAEVAACALLDLVCDFPFAGESDRSAWLAGVLTVIARPAIRGPVPLFAVDGTTRGSGKSRLVDACVRLACGHDAERSSLSSNEEEQRKQITSLLLGGSPVVLLDNVASNRKLGGPALDAVLTSVTWKERLLGQTTMLTLPALAVWWATGNNLQLAGDLARRCLKIRLASPLENPEARTDFKFPDLLREIDRRRAELVCHALTILRAYVVAGRPCPPAMTWGSFEAWSRLIPPAIEWLGLASPLEVRATNDQAADEEALHTMSVGACLEALGANTWETAITARELVGKLYPTGSSHEDDLPLDPSPAYAAGREALEVATIAKGIPNPQHVGKFLARVRDRVLEGRQIVRTFDAHVKIAKWYVRRVGSP